MKAATSSPERQLEDVVAAAESVGGHIMGWADGWEVSGATDPMTRPQLDPWLRDERGPCDGLVAAAVDRLGGHVVDCLNTGYKMRDDGKTLVTHGHEGPWDLGGDGACSVFSPVQSEWCIPLQRGSCFVCGNRREIGSDQCDHPVLSQVREEGEHRLVGHAATGDRHAAVVGRPWRVRSPGQ
ncbi:recombinase family protein [Streptomyces sp. XM4011]|uniref:recombinase family protein n=1 Tax=Streptomyces sp. XM4011 TaxID=2929780 RepID=UPI001FFAC937|nr:recombinase family protein [Streptomyces sp. XM4011]MCK1812874.1 recombinase family protein [Streptomyces sp. XM4011]